MAAESQCFDDRRPSPTLGVGVIHCQGGDCGRHLLEDGARVYDFKVRPRLWLVDEGSARGVLEGDEVLAVDGWPITTPEAGRLLGHAESGRRVVLRLRATDGSVERDVPVTGGEWCGPSRLVVTAFDDPDWEKELSPTARPRARPQQELGFAVACDRCSWAVAGGRIRWVIEELPRVLSVLVDSPADLAGLQAGDLLVAVDGEDVRSERGADALSGLADRGTINLTVRRGPDVVELELVIR